MSPHPPNISAGERDVSYLDSSKVLESLTPPVSDKEQNVKVSEPYRVRLVWRNIALFSYLHAAALYGLYLMVVDAKMYTNLWVVLWFTMSAMGTSAGCHRFFTHRTYKARLPLQIILATLQTISGQNSIYVWVRDHRLHHKYADTDADPHNASRGFFFSHIGWLLCRKHPDVIEKGKVIDLSDLTSNPVVMWQKRNYYWIVPLLTIAIPVWMPWYFWGESFNTSWHAAGIVRYVWQLNATWLINSYAHIVGNRPYDRNILATNSKFLTMASLGNGWHNYHHVFPWDYRSVELGNYSMNFTTGFINFFASFGWAYDLKMVPVDLVYKRMERTGDGTHKKCKSAGEHFHLAEGETPVWGWGDKDMPVEEKEMAIIDHRSE